MYSVADVSTRLVQGASVSESLAGYLVRSPVTAKNMLAVSTFAKEYDEILLEVIMPLLQAKGAKLEKQCKASIDFKTSGDERVPYINAAWLLAEKGKESELDFPVECNRALRQLLVIMHYAQHDTGTLVLLAQERLANSMIQGHEAYVKHLVGMLSKKLFLPFTTLASEQNKLRRSNVPYVKGKPPA